MSTKPKPGAKPGNTNAIKGDTPATSLLTVRCTPADKAAWVKAAGGKLAPWVIEQLNKSIAG